MNAPTPGPFGKHQFNLFEIVTDLLSSWITPDGSPMGPERAREIVAAWLQGERAIGVLEHARILGEMAQETGDAHFEAASFLASEAGQIMLNENPVLVIHRVNPEHN